MDIQQYLKEIKAIDRTKVKELGYRTPLHNFLNSIKLESKKISVIHEESNKDIDGVPDFSIYENMDTLFSKLVGYVECKKIDYDLDALIDSEQIKKYAKTSDNIIITNYREFILLQRKDKKPVLEEVKRIRLLEDDLSISKQIETQSQDFENLILDFFKYEYQNIKSKKQLVEVLSKQSFYLAQNLRYKIEKPTENQAFYKVFERLFKTYSTTLHYKYSKADFCDIYAQSLSYGLFISRLENPSLIFDEIKNNYVSYIPKNFTLLREFLEQGISSYTPQGIREVYRQVAKHINLIDIEAIQQEFAKQNNGRSNIIVHLYEDFLKEYDELRKTENRKENGVYYTPVEAVNFITKSVNEVIKDKLGKPKGFNDENVKILDFACGTGTFLSSIIEQMIPENMDSIAKREIKNKILTNVYGFELLFTPYLVAHIVLTKKLEEKGISLNNEDRLGIYLTNTLDLDSDIELSNLIFLNEENEKVHKIKQEENILAIVGNPPYFSGKSSNESKYIQELLKDYKKGLDEKNLRPLKDLYIQFIRFAEEKISRTQNGVIGIITNNSFIDGITHRQMRKHLLETFDEVYILNLHGGSKKGESDKNIFDITIGVNISIFVRNPEIKEKSIYYYSIKDNGKITRDEKLSFLNNNSLNTIPWKKLEIDDKNYWFIYKDFSDIEYGKFIKIKDIFNIYNSGFKTSNDKITMQYSKQKMLEIKTDFYNISEDILKAKYNAFSKQSWNISKVRDDVTNSSLNMNQVLYGPFDFRWTLLGGKSNGFMERPRYEISKHFDSKENIALSFMRNIVPNSKFSQVFISSKMININLFKYQSYCFPLYLYKDNAGELYSNNEAEKEVNFTPDFKTFIKNTYKDKYTPEDILAYIYGVMYSPVYRGKYLEFLKIDFPAIPFTTDEKVFEQYSELGQELIDLHLLKKDLEDSSISVSFSDTLKEGFIIEKLQAPKKDAPILKLTLANKQEIVFDGMTEELYNFEIGSYKPIDKWIKYRIADKVKLGFDDIKHIKNMAISIKKTVEIMAQLEELEEAYLK